MVNFFLKNQLNRYVRNPKKVQLWKLVPHFECLMLKTALFIIRLRGKSREKKVSTCFSFECAKSILNEICNFVIRMFISVHLFERHTFIYILFDQI